MNVNDKLLRIKKQAEESLLLRQAMIEQLGPKIIEAAAQISGVIGSGGKIMTVGNGALSATASMFASELVVRMSKDRQRQALPAMALSADAAVMTAAADDLGFENIFARQIEGLGHKGDMLMVLSANGGSSNLVRAVQTARERGVISFALLGGTGGRLATMVDRALIVPHPMSQRVEEEHLFLVHLLVDLIERDLFA